ncbi:N-acetylmuramic acid 6-phosphate etherase [Aerococcus kribbianus]|uniref:N-acetylmuramic acid 6-phosphate etherase n=1 Tax=Aerococcus kribbianus TaxID=2999064 RepID=A0A9X3JES0_9LACT|nr:MULTISPECIES: N-acetylmuramic acid 6-phosphate etherase [unclassified Aerococcus]MCZ0717439.1 N-acetylmuramic acid 6-phosphate etherase [Aerococcus sp. YH-aer221]MCZ0725727.1 N-acetylmuramic acid 6-phosphate etherase [Aerococcus sp. YH-aer222]
MKLEKLTTEQRNPNTMALDQMSVGEMLATMNAEDQGVAKAISEVLADIEEAVDKIIRSFNQGGRLIYIGAGTSGRLGVLDAAECVPTFGVSPDMVIGLIAGGQAAMFSAAEGAEDTGNFAETDLAQIALQAQDTVVGLAASGRTPYVISGLAYAETIGASTVALSCNKNAEISQYADVSIEVETGPEVLTGSTRLKAGTAQKLVLNMLSTCAMVGIGKVYQNLMVDVLATNQKLEDRAQRIIMEAADCSLEQAEQVFQAADRQVKVAIVMILTGLDKASAEEKIAQANGFINDIDYPLNKGGESND